MATRGKREVGRRAFLKLAGAGAAGLTLVSPGVAFGSAANEALRLGIIGCGGRGTWLGELFGKHASAKVVALHDYFRDRVDAAGDKFGTPAARRYVGLDGYRELLAADVDAVAVVSPPWFHPEQTAAAVAAGKHVYLAKPVAVDVPGCATIADAARKADGRLSVLVDFQTRANAFFQGAAQRVHDGMIGKPVLGHVFYHTAALSPRAQPGSETARLRNWLFDKALSGDIIVEQNIHVLDVANWYLRSRPSKAWGTGGRRARTNVGDCWDHFVVTYTYPDDAIMDFSSRQFGEGYEDLCIRLYGATGTVDSHYGGDVRIRGAHAGWAGGKTDDIYLQGAVSNIQRFCGAIAEGTPVNNAAESVESTLTCILGRTTAYENRVVTWEEMMAANTRLDPNLRLPADGPDQRE